MVMQDYCQMTLSSYEGRVIILDLAYPEKCLRELEKEVGHHLDDDKIYEAMFRALERYDTGLLEYQYCLLDIFDQAVCYEDLIFTDTKRVISTQYILNVCSKIATFLREQMKRLGMYNANQLRFMYHSRPMHATAAFVERQDEYAFS